MKRLNAWMAVTAAVVALAAAGLSAASASSRLKIKPGVLKPGHTLTINAPCAPGFTPSTTVFPDNGGHHSYFCQRVIVTPVTPKCRDGYESSGFKAGATYDANRAETVIRYPCRTPH